MTAEWRVAGADGRSFTAQVKLHAILVCTSASASAPRTMHLYVNRDDLDFAGAEATRPVQRVELAQTADVQKVPLRRALFARVHRLGLFVDSFGADVARLSYLGFRG